MPSILKRSTAPLASGRYILAFSSGEFIIILQSTVSIMLSGVLIVVAELITGGITTLIFALQELAPPEVPMADALKVGMDVFTAVMDNTATTEGQITRALYGIPMNILFVAVALLVYYLVKRRRAKKA